MDYWIRESSSRSSSEKSVLSRDGDRRSACPINSLSGPKISADSALVFPIAASIRSRSSLVGLSHPQRIELNRVSLMPAMEPHRLCDIPMDSRVILSWMRLTPDCMVVSMPQNYFQPMENQ